jgi:hypothetical protein
MLTKSTREKRDPQKAKKLRLLHDRVNAYGENDKASRKAIPRFKAETNRKHRHAVSAQLKHIEDGQDAEAVEARIATATFKGLHPSKRKEPDLPSAIQIARKKGVKASEAAFEQVHSLRNTGFQRNMLRTFVKGKERPDE